MSTGADLTRREFLKTSGALIVSFSAASVAGPFGPGRELFADQALTMACFPNDRSLKRLGSIFDEQARVTHLATLGLPPDAKIEPLRYRPERRFVGRVDWQGKAVAVLKLHAPDAYQRAIGNASVAVSGEALVVPRLLGAAERHGAVACEWLEGRPAHIDPSTARRIGAALAELHSQTIVDLAPLTPADQQASARAIAEDIAALLPALAERALALSHRIAALLHADAPAVPLHGDCHIDQVLDLGERIALVDFDEAALGPAAWDLGNLLAHLQLDAIAPSDLASFREALIDGYRLGGGLLRDTDLAAQTALALLRLALRPFRDQQVDWPAAIAAILDTAEDAVANVPPSVPSDPALPQLAAALDSASAANAFLQAGLTVEVASARLVRHKPGRRCLIAYDLVDRSGRVFKAFGKVRAKGVDSRVFALQQELWNDGFAPGGFAKARVAEPLALVPKLGLWLQAEAVGQPFTPKVCSPERAARAIGALHKARIRPLKRHLLSDELAILDDRLAALSERKPEWSARLEGLLHTAQSLAAQTWPVALRPIHRDFYHDHLLCNGDEQHLIDLDLLCLGDPAVDIGNFNAHLTELALREHGDPLRYGWWQMRFVSAACRSLNGARRTNVQVYEFLSLIRLIEISERMPERRASAAALLTLCEGMTHLQPTLSRNPR